MKHKKRGYGGGTGRLDDFYSFSFETNTWEEVEVLSDEKPGCRENNGVVIGDSTHVYLFGGYNGHAWLNDLWTFDIEAKQWTCLQESSDENENSMNQGTRNSSSSSSSAHSSRNSTTGGDQNNNSNNNSNSSNSNNNKAPSRRFGYVSVVHNNKFILWGGFDGSR